MPQNSSFVFDDEIAYARPAPVEAELEKIKERRFNTSDRSDAMILE